MTEQNFIEEMKAIKDDVTHGDMQGMVEVFTLANGGNDDKILNEIYND